MAVYNDLPPVCHWLDLLCLAERLAPEKPLLPPDPAGRAEAIGLSALVAGVDGIGWQRRLQLLAPGMQQAEPPAMVAAIAHRYGWSESALETAEERLVALLNYLDGVLAASEAAGQEWFLGAERSGFLLGQFRWHAGAAAGKGQPHARRPARDVCGLRSGGGESPVSTPAGPPGSHVWHPYPPAHGLLITGRRRLRALPLP